MPLTSFASPRPWLLLALSLATGCAREDPGPGPTGTTGETGTTGGTGATGPTTRAQRLEAAVTHLSVDLVPRNWEDPGHLDAAAAWISDHLEQAGGRVSEQTWRARGETYRNVIAAFGPADGPVLVVGAHYDASGGWPGADDNASGVAGLLELARELGAQPPASPVVLVGYSLEEPPFFGTDEMGSAVHAASLAAAGTEVVGMLSLEMIGYYRDEPGTQTYPDPSMALLYGDTGDFLAVVGRETDAALLARIGPPMAAAADDLRVISLAAPIDTTGIDFSDHRNYWSQGFTAAMVTDTAFYRNPNYHGLFDTADTLDYDRMAKAVDSVTAAVRALAGGDARR